MARWHGSSTDLSSSSISAIARCAAKPMARLLAPLPMEARAHFAGYVARHPFPVTSPHPMSTAASAEFADRASRCLKLTRFAFLREASTVIPAFGPPFIFSSGQRLPGVKLRMACRNSIAFRLRSIGERGQDNGATQGKDQDVRPVRHGWWICREA